VTLAAKERGVGYRVVKNPANARAVARASSFPASRRRRGAAPAGYWIVELVTVIGVSSNAEIWG